MYMEDKYILEMNNVSKKFDKSEFKLDNVSIKIPYGAIIGLVGENGNGDNAIMMIVQ